MMLMMVLVSGHQHRYMGMMDDIITNAAEECATDLAHASRSCHYKATALFFGHLTDYLARVTSYWFYFATDLQNIKHHMGIDARKPVFGGLRTTKAQTSLRICAVWSAPLLFTYWKVYLDLLQGKFQFSS